MFLQFPINSKIFLVLIHLVCISLTTAQKDPNEDFFKTSGDTDERMTNDERQRAAYLKSKENFTSCTQFLDDSLFDVKRVLNVSWQAFYFWVDENSLGEVPNIIFNFQLPNPTLIKRYKDAVGMRFKNVDWTAVELFVETNLDFSGILISTNQSGAFGLIPSLAFEYHMMDETSPMALKIVEPHYLGLMNCLHRHLLAFAPVGQLPADQEVQSVAKKFNFICNYGVSLAELKKKDAEYKKQTLISGEDDRNLNVIYDDPDDKNLGIF